MNPAIIVAIVIIIAFVIFAKFVYPKILERKCIDFSDKAKAFLDITNISYDNSCVVYAEQKKSKSDTAAKFGKQFALGIVGIQDYTGFVKYVIVYNTEHIIFIPVCVSELSGNIILCEENDEIIQDIKTAEISGIDIDNSLCTFNFNGTKKTIVIPDKAAPYAEQTELKSNFMKFAKDIQTSF